MLFYPQTLLSCSDPHPLPPSVAGVTAASAPVVLITGSLLDHHFKGHTIRQEIKIHSQRGVIKPPCCLLPPLSALCLCL